MRGAPARAIQELAGHQDLGTTQRYMHLSPAALDAAIRLLDSAESRGGIVEAPGKPGWNTRFSWEKWWRRRELHPGPKIHPRRNLRCVSASEVSHPA
jgi:hypothetical protein